MRGRKHQGSNAFRSHARLGPECRPREPVYVPWEPLIFYLLFIYLFLAALGLRCCARAFSSGGERGLLLVAACGLFTAVAFLVVEQGL